MDILVYVLSVAAIISSLSSILVIILALRSYLKKPDCFASQYGFQELLAECNSCAYYNECKNHEHG